MDCKSYFKNQAERVFGGKGPIGFAYRHWDYLDRRREGG